MNNFRIGTRLVLGFALMLLFIAVVTTIGIWRVQGSSSATIDLIEVRLTNERLINEWSKNTALNATRTLAGSKITDADLLASFQKDMKATSQRINELQDAVGKNITDDRAIELYNTIKERRSEYVSRRNAALDERAKGNIEAADAFFANDLEPLLDAYSKSVSDLLAYQQSMIDQRADELHANNKLGLWMLIGLGAGALVLGLLCAWLITRSITRPLNRAVSVAEVVSNRDLTQEISVQGKDETAQLLQALKRMNTNLQSVLSEVRSGADSIAVAANEIAAGNVDLSSRTEEQASSLAETAATMEELTTTVKQNTDNARQANHLANTAATVASRSGEAVSRVVTTMNHINESSRQMADIIGVIDSIAFQTNILALNAAVEAARAGEQGKGFAVVASEVRSLAQRSAQAAREIKDLIDRSTSITREGNQLVAEAGSTMEETVSSIRRLNDLMAEISSASEEQSIGIEQVNQAVSQMDQVTQQNAALVQEASAASDSLQDQATNLARLVSTFKLHDHSGLVIEDPGPHSRMPRTLALN